MGKWIAPTMSAFFLAALSLSAGAQGLIHKVQLMDVEGVCQSDARRLCPDVVAGRGRLAICLGSQLESLSQPCYDALMITAALKSCEADRARYCPGVIPGRGRVLRCLAQYTSELSQPCAVAVEANLPRLTND